MATEVGFMRLRVKSDTAEAQKDLVSLDKAFERTAKNIQKAANQLSVGKQEIPTEEYARLQEELEKADAALLKLYDSQEKMKGTGVSENSARWKNLQYDIKAAEEEVERYRAQLSQMESSGTAFAQPEVPSGDAAQSIRATDEEMQHLEQSASRVMLAIGKVVSAPIKAVGKLASGVSKVTKSFAALGKKASNIASKVTSPLKSLTKMASSMLGIYSLYRLFTKAANQYTSSNEEMTAKLESVWMYLGEVIGPVIETVVNMLMKAISVINSFIASLSGINIIAKANAKALDKQAKSASDASKQLASFDEMNKLNDTSDSGESTYTLDANVEMPDLVNMISESIQVGDWSGIGFVLADKIMGIWDSVDWVQLGQKLSDRILGLLSAVSTFLKEIEWQKIGNDVANFLASIDWSGIATALFDALGAALGGIAAFLKGLLGDALASVGSYFSAEIEKAGGNVIEGLWNGIVNALKNAGLWIYNHIFLPIINGFKDAFGIHSPSTVMAEQGGFIMRGLFNGIQNGLANIKKFFSELVSTIKSFFTGLPAWFKSIFQSAWTKIKGVFSNWGTFFSSLWTKIKNTFSKLGTSIGNAIGDAVKSGINSVLKLIENTINSAVRLINGAIDLINAIPGVSVGKVKELSLPRLARGGIVNNPGRGVPLVAGEMGREAVLPLENNTEWMDILAEKINGAGGQIVIPIYLDGKKIARYVIDLKNQREFALNGV